MGALLHVPPGSGAELATLVQYVGVTRQLWGIVDEVSGSKLRLAAAHVGQVDVAVEVAKVEAKWKLLG